MGGQYQEHLQDLAPNLEHELHWVSIWSLDMFWSLSTRFAAVGRKLWPSHPHHTCTNLLHCSCCWLPGKTLKAQPQAISTEGEHHWNPLLPHFPERHIENLLVTTFWLIPTEELFNLSFLQQNFEGIKSPYCRNICIFNFDFGLYLIQVRYPNALTDYTAMLLQRAQQLHLRKRNKLRLNTD